MKKNPLSQYLGAAWKAAKKIVAGPLMLGALVPFIASSPAKAQGVVPAGNQTYDFSATISGINGTGNGITRGTVENGSLTLNIGLLQLVGGGPNNGAAIYDQTSATVVLNGTLFENVAVAIANNVADASGNNIPSVLFDISWGPMGNNGIDIYAPNSIVPDDSLNSVQTLLNDGLTAALPYNGDATLSVGYEASGFDGAWGYLSSFQPAPVSTVPEPDNWLLGALGATILAGGLLRRSHLKNAASTIYAGNLWNWKKGGIPKKPPETMAGV